MIELTYAQGKRLHEEVGARRAKAGLSGDLPARLKAWKAIQRHLIHAPEHHSYIYCPICGSYLDWAWCASCRAYV